MNEPTPKTNQIQVDLARVVADVLDLGYDRSGTRNGDVFIEVRRDTSARIGVFITEGKK